jgi:hypothetical protein
MKKRILAVLLAVFVVSALFAGGGGQGSGSSGSGGGGYDNTLGFLSPYHRRNSKLLAGFEC